MKTFYTRVVTETTYILTWWLVVFCKLGSSGGGSGIKLNVMCIDFDIN